MTINILAIGDVVGDAGVDFLEKKLRGIKKLKNIAFTVVNGENAAVTGLTPAQADAILAAGADVITLGNHAFSRQPILPYLEDSSFILRPANISPAAAGRGFGVFDTRYGQIAVVNLIGRVGMDAGPDSPFYAAKRILKETGCKLTLIDFHAEATSEKAALARYLDGQITALWGTHTHVQTSDGCVLPCGTGFITDLGMTGPADSILGVTPELSIARFLGESRYRSYAAAPGDCKLEGAIFEVDTASGLCLSVEALRIT